MKNATKHLTTIGLVAGGVIAAGYAMYKLSDVKIVQEARNGFQGIR